MLLFTDLEPKQLEVLARVLQKLRVPTPGPGTGIEVLRTAEAVLDRLQRLEQKGQPDSLVAAAEQALRVYLDSMRFVAGVWAHQQKLVIGDLEAAINQRKDGEEG